MSETSGDFWLGPIRVEPDRLRVSLDERVVFMQPRVMDVLVALASSGVEVMSRRALVTLVWADTHVGYHALPRAVHEMRKVLEGLSPGCDLVETIPRRGYRLKIAPIPAASKSIRQPDRDWPAFRFNRRLLTAGVSLLMLGLTMHAVNLHGSGIHFFCAAIVLGVTLLPRAEKRKC